MFSAVEGSLRKIENGSTGPGSRPLRGDELRRAKRAYVTARFDLTRAERLLTTEAGPGEVAPNAGDLVLARILCLGHHRKLESPQGRRQTLS